MGKSSRTKGAAFERNVANEFTAHGVPARRGVGQSRGGGAEVEDVQLPLVHVECKAREQGSLYSALEQARRDATARGAGKRPLVVYKRNRRPVLAIMELSEFIALFAPRVASEASAPGTARESKASAEMTQREIAHELQSLASRMGELAEELRRRSPAGG